MTDEPTSGEAHTEDRESEAGQLRRTHLNGIRCDLPGCTLVHCIETVGAEYDDEPTRSTTVLSNVRRFR